MGPMVQSMGSTQALQIAGSPCTASEGHSVCGGQVLQEDQSIAEVVNHPASDIVRHNITPVSLPRAVRASALRTKAAAIWKLQGLHDPCMPATTVWSLARRHDGQLIRYTLSTDERRRLWQAPHAPGTPCHALLLRK